MSGVQAVRRERERKGDREMEGESREAEQKGEERLRETSNLLGNSEELSAFRYFKKNEC